MRDSAGNIRHFARPLRSCVPVFTSTGLGGVVVRKILAATARECGVCGAGQISVSARGITQKNLPHSGVFLLQLCRQCIIVYTAVGSL